MENGVQGPDKRQDASIIRVGNDIPSAKITNIFGMSGMTRSGHIFAAPELPTRSKDKGKGKTDIGERERTGPTMNDEAPIGKFIEEGDDFSKR